MYPPLYVLMRQTLTLNDKRGVYSRRSLALGLTYHQLSLKRKHDISIYTCLYRYRLDMFKWINCWNYSLNVHVTIDFIFKKKKNLEWGYILKRQLIHNFVKHLKMLHKQISNESYWKYSVLVQHFPKNRKRNKVHSVKSV